MKRLFTFFLFALWLLFSVVLTMLMQGSAIVPPPLDQEGVDWFPIALLITWILHWFLYVPVLRRIFRKQKPIATSRYIAFFVGVLIWALLYAGLMFLFMALFK